MSAIWLSIAPRVYNRRAPEIVAPEFHAKDLACLFNKTHQISNSTEFLALVGIPIPSKIQLTSKSAGTYSRSPTKFQIRLNFGCLMESQYPANSVDFEIPRDLFNKSHQIANSTEFRVSAGIPIPNKFS